MKPPFFLLWGMLLLAGSAPALRAQQPPRIGYICPAGIQRGTTCEVVVGGQFLNADAKAIFTANGLTATVVRCDKLLPGKRQSELQDYLREARQKAREAGEPPPKLSRFERDEVITAVLKDYGVTDDEIRRFLLKHQQRRDYRRQQNMQLSESIVLRVEAAPDAVPGAFEFRLQGPGGVSNPLTFCVGTLAETVKTEPKGATIETAHQVTLPTVINGQILPGRVDCYTFSATRGTRLVVAMQARDLVPYLADAVPGWFQPVVAIYDAKGREVAYSGAFRFNPDPVFCYEVPETGPYLLEIRDALYRGREDFVYRVTIGSVPFVTGVFPLGAPVGKAALVEVNGWNLSRQQVIVPPARQEGVRRPADLSNGLAISDVSFAADGLPEVAETEPNDATKTAQAVKLPVIVNGRIGKPGDMDQFSLRCKSGEKVVVEVAARRLNSPLDSWIKVTPAEGRQIAFNDDQEDKGAGLLTHHADSSLTFTAPADGVYQVQIGDTQRKGGPEYAYRLRISPPRPDFALRWVPSALNGRPGVSVPVTVYAVRKDGFAGDITLTIKEGPPGLQLQGGRIPAGQEKVQATVTFPDKPLAKPERLAVEGRAVTDGREIVHPAVPADDLLQAFAYHHLVPAQTMLAMSGGTNGLAPLRLAGVKSLELKPGGSTQVVLNHNGGIPRVGPEFKLQLIDPPEGITLGEIQPIPEGMAVSVQVAPDVKPGLAGNLILEASAERMVPPDKKAEKKRWVTGTLPAVPFKVVRAGSMEK